MARRRPTGCRRRSSGSDIAVPAEVRDVAHVPAEVQGLGDRLVPEPMGPTRPVEPRGTGDPGDDQSDRFAREPAPGETWAAIDCAPGRGNRGLPGDCHWRGSCARPATEPGPGGPEPLSLRAQERGPRRVHPGMVIELAGLPPDRLAGAIVHRLGQPENAKFLTRPIDRTFDRPDLRSADAGEGRAGPQRSGTLPAAPAGQATPRLLGLLTADRRSAGLLLATA
jgi:hypothetical protein